MDVFESQLCSRARFWASLRVDGELSELEGALLDAHLANCEACRSLVSGLESTTAVLRSAPAEQMAPIIVSLPRSPRRFFAAAGVAAVLAASVLAGMLVRGEVSTGSQPTPHAVAVLASVDTADQLRRLRRTTLVNERRLPREFPAEPA